ncbi:recombination regulator RecX [Lacisediminimonas sp.]|uniref:recombination regulator RecX n=1 Tax=Lacisediminimonas sp. TaxID=3060582 RepID=UPI00271A08E5|nr:recombination regulator RecX [Lacisediminimonas sp.]MDO8300030.1 recombination regulator RecX [Lacisediminimonas sp.]MDO9219238.1 recombination regulator RecX [Lacisediminimonas sp.]
MPAPKLSLKARALGYLSAREHSRIELARKLGRYANEDDDIDSLLDQLEAAKLLSDSRFSESLVHRRAARYGNRRILSELQTHGLQDESLAQLKIGLAQDETQRARQVLRKKYATAPADGAERAKRMRFLMQRGFTMTAIREAMQSFADDPDEPYADA